MKKAYTFNHNPLLSERLPPWRARCVLILLLIGSCMLVVRAMYLQGVAKDFLQHKGESRYARTLELPATRGKIMDREGDTLATSTVVKSLYAVPDMVKATPAEIARLAKILRVPSKELGQRLKSKRDYVYLAREVPPEVAERALALKISGIQAENEFRRYYPSGEMTAHLVGFTNIDDKGQEGIELAYNAELTGTAGARRVIRDRRGAIVEDVATIRQPQNGQDIQLALDSKIQFLAYSALKQAMNTYHAKAGDAVVLDVRTGEVLALVNEPTYNPNNRKDLTGAQLRNRAITDSFEPGSVMKPFVVGMALESKKFRPDTEVDIGNGHLTLDGRTIGDSHQDGGFLTVSQVIQKSSNIGAAKIALNFSPQQMWGVYDSLGFGRQMKLGFPGEGSGRLRPWKSWRPIEQATMSYGHGVSVTLMQLAHAYLVFARDGELIPLSLTRVDGPVLHGRQIFSPRVAHQVLTMLQSVTEPGGTAIRAQVPGYKVGGKTGTAYKLVNGQYTRNYQSSFVGIVPVSDPRLVIAVSVDEPKGAVHYGGDVAGPVFSQIAAGALRSMGVQPDAPIVPLQVAQQRANLKREDM